MQSRRRVALFGGSFDPPHVAHVLTVAYGLSACPVDEVWAVPVWQHAFGKPLSPFEHRVAMVERALAPFGHRARISRVEQEMGAESRTIDTVRHLTAAHPDLDFSLLMGADLFAEREDWKNFRGLQALVTMHVVGRTGVAPPADHPVGPPLPGVSSTEVRARLRAGRPVEGLLPLTVRDYIVQEGLYSGA